MRSKPSANSRQHFLPVSRQDLAAKGWEQLDFVLASGDAYVDHPSFGPAIIGRVLESEGFKVGIIAQPDWLDSKDFQKLGRPRLAFLVTAGNMDSLVNHYTVNKKRRSKDYFSPGGKMGLRPDRATIVYCNRIREAYRNIPLIIGGIEASLRRFAHYDYWSDKVRNSILVDSGADLLVYGMGEKQIAAIAHSLKEGVPVKDIRHLPGTCYLTDSLEEVGDCLEIPSCRQVAEDKASYAAAFRLQYLEQDPYRGKALAQLHGKKYLVQNRPAKQLSREELDKVYALPFQKNYHPLYEKEGGVPALAEVKFSLLSSRGCYGDCSFCALAFHQGRIVQSRSEESLVQEAVEITKLEDFKGYIHDVGGPTANFRQPACAKQLKAGVCKDKQCLYPQVCKSIKVDHEEYLSLLRRLRSLPKVKKVFVRSGIRYDYVLADKKDKFLRELLQYHISGQLKVAPEHISAQVLKFMGKPAGKYYEQFRRKFFALNRELGKEQYLIPYFMSSHPGSTLASAIELAEYMRDTGYQPEQVQDFYPTPGTMATAMYYTGLHPLTGEKVYVPKSSREKAMQRALLQYSNPQNYDLVKEALIRARRSDLIGFGPKCLIPPRPLAKTRSKKKASGKTNSGRTGSARQASSDRTKERPKDGRSRVTGPKSPKNKAKNLQGDKGKKGRKKK